MSLLNPSGATLAAPNAATLTITDVGAANPPPPNPFISELVPYTAPVNFTLTFPVRVLGSGFDAAGAQVIWNNTVSLPVVVRSTSEIDVMVDPVIWNNISGPYPMVVRNPGNVNSNAAIFTVRQAGSGAPPPYVVQQPLANPNPTYGTTTTLTVLGGTFSSGGESVLTYDWEPVGAQPALYSFSTNKSHAANNMTATFNGAGIFHFRVTITDTLTGFSVNTNTLDVAVIAKAASLTLSPKYQVITPDQRLTLTAVIRDQFGALMNPTLNWSSSGGSLSVGQNSAVLSVNPVSQTIHITAVTQDSALSDSADVTVVYGTGGVGDISQAVPAPVPYKSNSGLPGVTFKRLNAGSKVRIFSTDGRLVRTLTSPDGTDQLFNLQNSQGDRVSSGVYLYIIDWSGQKKEGKIVLIL